MNKSNVVIMIVAVVGFVIINFEATKDHQDQLVKLEQTMQGQATKIAELQQGLDVRKEIERHRAEMLHFAIISRGDGKFVTNDDKEFAIWAYLVSLAEPAPNASRLKESEDGVPWTVQFRGEFSSGYSAVVAVEGPYEQVLRPYFVIYGGNQPGSLFRMKGFRDGLKGFKEGEVLVESLVSSEWQPVEPKTAEECLLAADRDLSRFIKNPFYPF